MSSCDKALEELRKAQESLRQLERAGDAMLKRLTLAEGLLRNAKVHLKIMDHYSNCDVFPVRAKPGGYTQPGPCNCGLDALRAEVKRFLEESTT